MAGLIAGGQGSSVQLGEGAHLLLTKSTYTSFASSGRGPWWTRDEELARRVSERRYPA
ncbi:hypothetical protein [Streptosporangium longisporum]|uniref:hypothetical protein n=1 Tax=Streptosporangium longisporum TaxID=46187 RepID=UPI0031E8FDD5